MTAPSTPKAAFINWRAILQGLDAETIRLDRDEENNARWLHLDARSDVSIRIDLKYPADLERDRKGLRRLAAAATQIAQEIEQAQRGPEGGPS